MSFKKILVIRFSSMGDIVLTTPMLRCLYGQKNVTLHYLTKKKYVEILKNNPYVQKIFSINKSVKEVIYDLKSEDYDLVIDLQKNLKSFFLIKKLKTSYMSFNKKNIKKWILVNVGVDLLKGEHIVDRYFSSLNKMNVYNDQRGLDYFIDEKVNKNSLPIKLNIEKSFFVWVLGGTYKQKKIPENQIKKVCENIRETIVFLGGKKELKVGEEIVKRIKKPNVYNLCGKLSIDQSAYIIKNSSLVLTNDTGLMHISSAFKKKIISFWGCTKPSLGMAPYQADKKSIQLISTVSRFPCSKLGNRCKHSFSGCINNISAKDILIAINRVNKV